MITSGLECEAADCYSARVVKAATLLFASIILLLNDVLFMPARDLLSHAGLDGNRIARDSSFLDSSTKLKVESK